MDKRKHRLRTYSYRFEWRHRTESSAIISMEVRTPRSNEFVSHMTGPGVVVWGIMTDEPTVKLGVFSMQTLSAIAAEIESERMRLLEARHDAMRELKAESVSINEILAHKSTSLRAKDHIT